MTEAIEDLQMAAGTGRAVLVPGLVASMTVGTLALGAFVPRDLSQGENAPIWNTSTNLLAFDLSRALTAVILLVSVVTIATVTIRRGFPRVGLGVWVSYLAFAFSNFLLPSLTAQVRTFDYRLLYAPLLFTAVYLASPVATDRLVAISKAALLAFVYGSLAAAVVIPDTALAGGFSGLLPGIDARLYGIGGGATSLGTLSAAFLTVETVSPSRSRLRWLHIGAGVVALLLTQARTSWLFVLAVILVWTALRLGRRLAPSALWAGPSARAARVLLLTCGLAGVAAVAVVAVGRTLLEPLQGDQGLELLTGRPYIWATSLGTWLDSPAFGYGLGLWESVEYRARYGGFDHAHNQFIHSLASAGVVGLLGLLVYLRAAWIASVQAARTSAVPFVLLAGILVLCLTNTPLRSYHVLDAFMLLHLLFFAFLVQVEGREGG